MSYGTDHAAQWQRGAEIVDLILKGAKPADIPVEQPTKFELVINLKTAKALGLTIPPSLLLRADQLIEFLESLGRQRTAAYEYRWTGATAFTRTGAEPSGPAGVMRMIKS